MHRITARKIFKHLESISRWRQQSQANLCVLLGKRKILVLSGKGKNTLCWRQYQSTHQKYQCQYICSLATQLQEPGLQWSQDYSNQIQLLFGLSHLPDSRSLKRRKNTQVCWNSQQSREQKIFSQTISSFLKPSIDLASLFGARNLQLHQQNAQNKLPPTPW